MRACLIETQNKIVLGRLIHACRKSQKRGQKEILGSSFNQEICSRSTLNHIEAGGVTRDDEIYHRLIRNLGYTYHEDEGKNCLVKEINQALHHCLIHYELKEMEKLQDQIQRISWEDFYYVHLLQSWKNILAIAMEQRQLTAEEYKWSQKLISVFEFPLSILLINMCFKHAQNKVQNALDVVKYETLILNNQEDIIMKLDLTYLDVYRRDFFDFYELNNGLNEYFILHQLDNLRLKNLALLISVSATENQSLLPGLLAQYGCLVNEKSNLNPIILKHTLYNIAMITYAGLKDYSKAVGLMEQIISTDLYKIYIFGVFYFDACERVGHSPLCNFLEQMNMFEAAPTLQYFIYKYREKKDSEFLVSFLSKVILAELILKKNTLLNSIYIRQWERVINDSEVHYYREYYLFVSKLEKNT